MKILLAHNHYGSEAPSGENAVFELERKMLEQHGHEVQTFERHSDEIRQKGRRGLIAGALATPWNPASALRMRKIVKRFKPDIIHVHNTFPLLSPSIFPAGRGAGRVLTMHNYRLFCPAAIPLRDGSVCTECIDRRSIVPSLRYGCYRNSRIATLPLAANVAIHRACGTWQNEVEAFIALTEFQRDCSISGGLPTDKVWVKPNFYPGKPSEIPFADRSGQVVYVGRLSEEKGVNDLIDAWLGWGGSAPELRVIGDGPMRKNLELKTVNVPNIRFLGQLSRDAAQLEISNARLLILPSRWFEGFPMVIREAFAFGTPSLVSDLGPLPELVSRGEGIVFQAGNVGDLLEKAIDLISDESQLEVMSRAARRAFENFYTEDVNYLKLMKIYSRAIAIKNFVSNEVA